MLGATIQDAHERASVRRAAQRVMDSVGCVQLLRRAVSNVSLALPRLPAYLYICQLVLRVMDEDDDDEVGGLRGEDYMHSLHGLMCVRSEEPNSVRGRPTHFHIVDMAVARKLRRVFGQLGEDGPLCETVAEQLFGGALNPRPARGEPRCAFTKRLGEFAKQQWRHGSAVLNYWRIELAGTDDSAPRRCAGGGTAEDCYVAGHYGHSGRISKLRITTRGRDFSSGDEHHVKVAMFATALAYYGTEVSPETAMLFHLNYQPDQSLLRVPESLWHRLVVEYCAADCGQADRVWAHFSLLWLRRIPEVRAAFMRPGPGGTHRWKGDKPPVCSKSHLDVMCDLCALAKEMRLMFRGYYDPHGPALLRFMDRVWGASADALDFASLLDRPAPEPRYGGWRAFEDDDARLFAWLCVSVTHTFHTAKGDVDSLALWSSRCVRSRRTDTSPLGTFLGSGPGPVRKSHVLDVLKDSAARKGQASPQYVWEKQLHTRDNFAAVLALAPVCLPPVQRLSRRCAFGGECPECLWTDRAEARDLVGDGGWFLSG